MAESYKLLFPEEFYKKFLKEWKRPDNRNFTELRELTISKGSISTSDSSVIVSLCGTKIITVIKKEIVPIRPGDDISDFIVLHFDIPNLCGFQHKSYASPEYCRKITHFLYEALKSSQCIKLENFILEDDKMTYIVLQIDVMCLSYDGNMHDAVILSLIAALLNMKLEKEILNIDKLPSTTTFSIIDGIALMDPTYDEERLASSTAHITCSPTGELVSLQNFGGGLSNKGMRKCIKLAQESSANYFTILKALTN